MRYKDSLRNVKIYIYTFGFSYCFCLLKLYQQNAAGKIMCSMYSVRKPLRFFYTDVGTLKKVFFSCFSLYSHRWKLCQHCLRQPFMTWTILALPTSSSSIQVKHNELKRGKKYILHYGYGSPKKLYFHVQKF